ncbi:unnamed protein product [Staurois parvus]|uniref:Uncharacterized protein n=1 Tax=Staurois parvus TaxID=386267 RepID=A0ABN9GNT5_9NEOB|nr:unnamed protein product [Staurois parvus]
MGIDWHNRWALTSGSTGGRRCWAALLGTDHQGTNHQCFDDRCRSLL